MDAEALQLQFRWRLLYGITSILLWLSLITIVLYSPEILDGQIIHAAPVIFLFVLTIVVRCWMKMGRANSVVPVTMVLASGIIIAFFAKAWISGLPTTLGVPALELPVLLVSTTVSSMWGLVVILIIMLNVVVLIIGWGFGLAPWYSVPHRWSVFCYPHFHQVAVSHHVLSPGGVCLVLWKQVFDTHKRVGQDSTCRPQCQRALLQVVFILIHNISYLLHEIRNPLQSISSIAEEVAEHEPVHYKDLHIIVDCCRHIKNVVVLLVVLIFSSQMCWIWQS